MTSSVSKGLVVVLISLIATSFAQTGFTFTLPSLEVLGINAAITAIGYLVTNAVFPTTSILGIADLRDVLKMALTGLASGLGAYVATLATNTAVNWHTLLTTVGAVMFGAILKSFKTAPVTVSSPN